MIEKSFLVLLVKDYLYIQSVRPFNHMFLLSLCIYINTLWCGGFETYDGDFISKIFGKVKIGENLFTLPLSILEDLHSSTGCCSIISRILKKVFWLCIFVYWCVVEGKKKKTNSRVAVIRNKQNVCAITQILYCLCN